jgi:vancomycin resistance protein VanJ
VTHATFAEILLGLYAVGVLVWFLLRTAFSDRVTLVLLGDYLGVWLFAPLLPLVAWVAIARYAGGLPLWSIRLTLFAAIPALLFLRFYGPALLPPRRGAPVQTSNPGSARSFSVLTFNLLYDNRTFEAVRQLLLASEADVLALQEVRPPMHNHLRRGLEARYPYSAFMVPAGLAVYSRFPILHEEILPFEPWPAQRLTLQVEAEDRDGAVGTGVAFHLINAHLAPVGIFSLARRLDASPAQGRAQARKSQVNAILETLPEHGNGAGPGNPGTVPTIVACDCNMTELNSMYAAMTQRLRDAYRQCNSGLGHTFIIPRGFSIPSPVNIPAQRLDYIFHSDELIAEAATIIPDPAGSDHLPVMARFSLPLD